MLIKKGSSMDTNNYKYEGDIPDVADEFGSTPTLTVCLGVIIFLISLLGCYGTHSSNSCMLNWVILDLSNGI